MSHRIVTKKRFPIKDLQYNSYLISLFINKLLKNGKKKLAFKIVANTFKFIQIRTKEDPLLIFEKAIKNISPKVQIKAKRIKGATYQVPSLLTKFRSTNLAIRWLIQYSIKRNGKNIATKLASEILDAVKGLGNAIKKKEETHKMAEANKAFLTL